VSATASDKVDLLRQRVRDIVGPDGVIDSPVDLVVYECDGYTLEKQRPDLVAFPRNTEQVRQLILLCNELDVPFMPRGAGTSLAGGTVPVAGGLVICFSRMNRILEINLRDRYAVVEPGVVNLWITNRLRGTGYHYAPDPSSQGACTIGGNVATNSGGPHTLKYGVTVNHVLGLTAVLPDGTAITTGGKTEDNPGYDLTGLLVGSEGTLAIVTEVIVRITRDPESYRTLLGVFDSIEDATNTISDIIGAGIVPAALEMMDRPIIRAVEEAFHFGFPLDAEAVLIIEVDGLEVGLDREVDRILELCRKNRAREVRRARDDAERAALWKSRKQAFGAIGRLASSYCTQDGVVPRTALPHMLRFISEVSKRHDVPIANVFHAGDGNIHPILLFDERDQDQVQRVLKASREILEECIRLGGSVTGEHGIGVEKINFMPKLFSPEDLAVMVAVHDLFNPDSRLSPGKMLPIGVRCLEPTHPGRRAPV